MVDLFNPYFRGAGTPGVPGVGSTQRGLQMVRQGENVLEQQRMGLQTSRDAALLDSLVKGSQVVSQIQDPMQKLEYLRQRKDQLQQAGLDTSHTDEGIAMLEAGDVEGFNQVTQDILELGKEVGGTGGNIQQAVTIQGLGTQFTTRSGEVGLRLLEPEEREAVLSAEREKAERELGQTAAKEAAKLKAQRTSDMITEMSTKNREAARSGRTISQALKLAGQATQGLSGAAKLKLGKLLPGIDVSDEAALDATLNELALEQLTKFKGPTTDFEFNVTQDIAGNISDPAEANIARIKSLDRARWFNEREFDQFQRHIKSGGDPDAFRFNYGEQIETKKGVFTLQDILDTAAENHLTMDETIQRLNR